MLTSAEAHAASLEQLEALDPATFNWSGQDYACLASSLTRSRALSEGGFASDAALVIYVRPEVFGGGDQPQTKETLTANGRALRIETIITPRGSPFLKLICVDATRGA